MDKISIFEIPIYSWYDKGDTYKISLFSKFEFIDAKNILVIIDYEWEDGKPHQFGGTAVCLINDDPANAIFIRGDLGKFHFEQNILPILLTGENTILIGGLVLNKSGFGTSICKFKIQKDGSDIYEDTFSTIKEYEQFEKSYIINL